MIILAELPPIEGENVLRLLGRLHPVVVHFPIALLISALLFEGLRCAGPKRGTVSSASLACIAIAAAGGAIAAWFGWISQAMEPQGSSVADIVFWHRWLGIGAAGAAAGTLVLGLLAARRPRARWAYRLLLLIGAGLVGYTGHLGGSLVYGEGRFVEAIFPTQAPPTPGEPVSAPDVAELEAVAAHPPGLAGDVLEIFEASCIECHGPQKQKGKLRLDSIDRAMSREGVVAPGYPEESELYLRLTLPSDHEDFMPSEGEPLSADAIERIRQWILLAGLEWGGEASGAGSPPAPPGAAFSREEVDAAINRLRSAGVAAAPVAEGDARIDVNASVVGRGFTDEHVALLAGLEPVLRSLDLSGTAISDGAITDLSPFTALERLTLNRTAITGSTLAALAVLPRLEHLGLFATEVDDAALRALEGFPRLERVFLSQSRVTADGVRELAGACPNLRVEAGAAFGPAAPPPDVVAARIPGCCQAALDRGAECDHACCVEARSQGIVCAKCLGG